MQIFPNSQALLDAKGNHLGYSNWHAIEQSQIDMFAEATGDHQWIHVDPERAAEGPFGTTIAHGHLTLSLVPKLLHDVYKVEGTRMGVNYGLNKVRFTAVVPVGSEVRAGAEIVDVQKLEGDAFQITMKVIVERQGSDKPVCVAESIARYYF